MSTLFENALILQKDENGNYYGLKGYLGIKDDLIAYIGKDKPNEDYDRCYDYSNKLLMPGLYDSHSHIPMVMLRGVGAGLPLQEWLYDAIFPLEAKLVEEDIKWASYYALLELIASGVCSFTDMYFLPWICANAVIEGGMKANLDRCVQCFDENQRVEDSTIGESLQFYKDYDGKGNGRLKVDFAIHAEYTNKPHIMKAYAKVVKENKGRIHLHLAETKKEVDECKQRYGCSPVKLFEDLGVLDSPVIAAHCIHVDEDDISILKRHDVSLVHNPTSNMMLGSGFMPLKKFLDMGFNVGLGTDGPSSNNNLNMFEEMHIASLIHCGYHLDPTNITSDQIINMATINGAKLQGRRDCGQLEVGYKADVIGLDLNHINAYPNLDLPALITHSLQGSDVFMNMVDGKMLYLNGEYLTLDEDLIRREFKKRVEDFYK